MASVVNPQDIQKVAALQRLSAATAAPVPTRADRLWKATYDKLNLRKLTDVISNGQYAFWCYEARKTFYDTAELQAAATVATWQQKWGEEWEQLERKDQLAYVETTDMLIATVTDITDHSKLIKLPFIEVLKSGKYTFLCEKEEASFFLNAELQSADEFAKEWSVYEEAWQKLPKLERGKFMEVSELLVSAAGGEEEVSKTLQKRMDRAQQVLADVLKFPNMMKDEDGEEQEEENEKEEEEEQEEDRLTKTNPAWKKICEEIGQPYHPA